MSQPRIVLLGGGTGSFALLPGLRKLTTQLTAIVSMSDDGGSTGVLRDELGVLPPGDIRQCLVGMSDSKRVRELFDYRFSEGRFEGQSLGNIILSGLELRHGNFEKAIEVAGEVLGVQGSVVPVTLENHTLVMRCGSKTVRGQSTIETFDFKTAPEKLWLEPAATANPNALSAIKEADLVVIAPGSVYTSILPILLVEGIPEALQKTKATVVAVANLINKPRQTDDWHVLDYLDVFEKQIGKGTIDIVLYNTAPISSELLGLYAADGEYPVLTSEKRFRESSIRSIGVDLLAIEIAKQNPADKAIRRTLIRHDGTKVRQELQKLLRRRRLHIRR